MYSGFFIHSFIYNTYKENSNSISKQKHLAVRCSISSNVVKAEPVLCLHGHSSRWTSPFHGSISLGPGKTSPWPFPSRQRLVTNSLISFLNSAHQYVNYNILLKILAEHVIFFLSDPDCYSPWIYAELFSDYFGLTGKIKVLWTVFNTRLHQCRMGRHDLTEAPGVEIAEI